MSSGSISNTHLSSSAGVDVVQRLYAAFEQRDAIAALAEMAKQIEWNEAESFIYSDRNPYWTRAEVADGVFWRLAIEWLDYNARATEFFAAGDAVIAIGRSTGAHVRTGKLLDAQFVHIWRLCGGRIVGFQQYTDTLQF